MRTTLHHAFAAVLLAGLCQAAAAQTTPKAAAPNVNVKQAAPATAPAADDAKAKTQVAVFSCKGPLQLEMVSSGSAPSLTTDLVLNFTGAESAAAVQPGQCWRAGGWGFPRSLGERRAGRLVLSYPLGPCPMFQTLKMSNGRITDFKLTTQGNGGKFAWSMLEAAAQPGRTLTIDTRFLFGANIGTAGATYGVYAPQGDIYKPERCN